jgi:hypothetical protein
VDDEYEAAAYINQYVKNAVAFVMIIAESDMEVDCTTLNGSNDFHEFRYVRTVLFRQSLTYIIGLLAMLVVL